MRFIPTELKGAYLIEHEPIEDNRGFFARSFCQRDFEAQGLNGQFVQCNLSWNRLKGTLRGMHYQAEPYAEVKLVRCTRGTIYDVILDLRPQSPTWGKWIAAELSAENRRMIYIPQGFAHGYQTLEDDTETFYMVSQYYAPGFERGVRWNDPAFGIVWPLPDPILSSKDRSHPDYKP